MSIQPPTPTPDAAPAPALRPDLLSTDPARLAAAGQDFGDIVRAPPAYVARPRSDEEVAELLRFARARGLAVAARGVGHSTGGQAQVAGGLVLDMAELAQIHAIDVQAQTVEAGAGLRWRALMAELAPLGLTPPVVTDWLELSLGGTISAGGVGAQSFRAGLQTDAVEALRAVTGTGEIIECSRTHERELFDALRGGLGQFGVITRVRMRLEPAPAALTLDHLLFDELDRFLAASAALMQSGAYGLLAHALPNRPEDIARSLGCVPAQLRSWRSGARWLYHLELSQIAGPDHGPLPGPTAAPTAATVQELARSFGAIEPLATRQLWNFNDFVHRVPPIVERDRRVGHASHPRITLFVAHEHARALIAKVMDELQFNDLGGGPILLVPFQTGAIHSPFVRLPIAEKVWLFGILRAATTPDCVATMTRANVDMWRSATDLGALRYPVDGLPEPSSKIGWAAHYGPLWPQALASKRRFDPHRLLAPGLGIFAD
jgi:cytokinin dehydrogenase